MGRVDATILNLAAERGGAVHVRTLRAAGVSWDAINVRIDEGSLLRLPHGVVLPASAGRNPPLATRLHAAVLGVGGDRCLSHDTAVAHHGAWPRWTGTIHVTSSVNVGPSRIPGVVHHRAAAPLPAEAICIVDDIPTLVAPWACALLGTELTDVQVTYVIGQLRFLGLFEPGAFEDLLHELGRRRGIRAVRSALAMHQTGSAGTRSRSEDRVYEALRRAGAPPPLVNVRGAALVGVELDFVWPRHRLVVECDGGQHAFEHAARSDACVDALLQERDWHSIRLPTARIWGRMDLCVREVLRTLDERRPGRVRRHRRDP